MFTLKEMQSAMLRLMQIGELPGFVCVLVDAEDQFEQPPVNHIGDYSTDDLPRVCFDLRKYLFDEDDGKKKREKKYKKFKDYLFGKKFINTILKDSGMDKGLRKKFDRFYVKDFRTVPVDQILDTKSKDAATAEFKGELGLLITFAKGPKK